MYKTFKWALAGSVRTKISAAVPFRRSDLNGRTRPLLIFGCYICVAVFPKTMMMWHDRKWRTCCGTVSQKRLKWILSECCNEYDAHIHFNCNMTKTLEQLKSYGNTKKEKRTAVLVPFRRSDLNGRTRPLLIFGCYICVAVFPKTMMMWHGRKWRTCCGTVSQKRLKWLNVAFSTARRAWAVILPTHWNMFIWELRKW